MLGKLIVLGHPTNLDKSVGKLIVLRHSTNLDKSRARAYYSCSRCVVWTFFLSSIMSLFSLPLSGTRPDID